MTILTTTTRINTEKKIIEVRVAKVMRHIKRVCDENSMVQKAPERSQRTYTHHSHAFKCCWIYTEHNQEHPHDHKPFLIDVMVALSHTHTHTHPTLYPLQYVYLTVRCCCSPVALCTPGEHSSELFISATHSPSTECV